MSEQRKYEGREDFLKKRKEKKIVHDLTRTGKFLRSGFLHYRTFKFLPFKCHFFFFIQNHPFQAVLDPKSHICVCSMHKDLIIFTPGVCM